WQLPNEARPVGRPGGENAALRRLAVAGGTKKTRPIAPPRVGQRRSALAIGRRRGFLRAATHRMHRDQQASTNGPTHPHPPTAFARWGAPPGERARLLYWIAARRVMPER